MTKPRCAYRTAAHEASHLLMAAVLLPSCKAEVVLPRKNGYLHCPDGTKYHFKRDGVAALVAHDTGDLPSRCPICLGSMNLVLIASSSPLAIIDLLLRDALIKLAGVYGETLIAFGAKDGGEWFDMHEYKSTLQFLIGNTSLPYAKLDRRLRRLVKRIVLDNVVSLRAIADAIRFGRGRITSLHKSLDAVSLPVPYIAELAKIAMLVLEANLKPKSWTVNKPGKNPHACS